MSGGTKAEAASRIHLPSLAAGVGLMLLATLYPPLMTSADGRVDHGMAAALFMAMSAGLVRGVGFVPERAPLRWLFSGWTCLAALLLAVWL
ncbi:MAG TPA: cyd operon YbgE family protein [Duganella sp.]|nr:cyd operon YbgE family protein [Duganella sp.]